MTFHKAVSARQISKSARAAMGNIMQIWSKTSHFKNQNSSSDSQLTPTFISWLEKAWVGNMISCLIWPSINSWRHHNGLRTQNFNLHIMTSADFWKIDCISVNIDQFSFKFWYVLPGNILYKCSYHDHFILTMASWRIFAIKGGMSIFHILRVFSMGHDFFSKLDSTSCLLRAISPSF